MWQLCAAMMCWVRWWVDFRIVSNFRQNTSYGSANHRKDAQTPPGRYNVLAQYVYLQPRRWPPGAKHCRRLHVDRNTAPVRPYYQQRESFGLQTLLHIDQLGRWPTPEDVIKVQAQWTRIANIIIIIYSSFWRDNISIRFWLLHLFDPHKIKKNSPKKVVHNPTRPPVVSRASFCFAKLKQF